MCCAWVITDYHRPSSAVNWRKAHVLAVDSESDTKTRWRPTWSAATLHLPSELRSASTGSVRLAIALQNPTLKQVVSGHWKPSGNSGRQGNTWTLPASPATSADVLVLRGSGYMHNAHRHTHLPTWVYCDPRSVVSTAQSTTLSKF